MFDVRCSLVSYSIRPAVFLAGGSGLESCGILNFGHCDLFGIWYLCFGISGLSGLGFSPAAGLKSGQSNRKETSEHRTLNIERRTSNNVFCQFKKKMEQNDYSLRNSIQLNLSQAAVFRSRIQRDCLVLKSIKRSVIQIRCSMLDVQCSMFNLFTVPTRRSFIRGVGFQTPLRFRVSGYII